MSRTFAQLGVPDSIVRSLSRQGITRPFDIQTATLADALAGHDVCGRAPTGSGKTLAFGIQVGQRIILQVSSPALRRTGKNTSAAMPWQRVL